jgi:hypothetical protein
MSVCAACLPASPGVQPSTWCWEWLTILGADTGYFVLRGRRFAYDAAARLKPVTVPEHLRMPHNERARQITPRLSSEGQFGATSTVIKSKSEPTGTDF